MSSTKANANIIASRLPSDIFAQVFPYLVKISDISSSWKTLLPHLAVCHNWREAARPFVYRTVYISSKCPAEIGMWVGGIHKPSVCGMNSNIKLAHMTGNFKYAKLLHIEMECLSSMRNFVEKMQGILSAQNNAWSNITALYYKDSLYTFELFTYELLEPAMDLIAKSVPNVTKLNIFSNIASIAGTIVHQCLINKFSNQLVSFKCNSGVKVPKCKFSSALTTLSVCLNEIPLTVISSINTDTLRILQLKNVSYTFTWPYFNNENKTQTTRFPNLVDLKLYFKNDVSNNYLNKAFFFTDGEDFMQLPMLENVLLVNIPVTLEKLFADSSLHPPHKTRFVLPQENTGSIHHEVWNDIIFVTIAYGFRRLNKIIIHNIIYKEGNHLVVSNPYLSREIMGNIGKCLSLYPTNISGSSLSELYLDKVVNVYAITDILKHLPNLRRLEIKIFKCQRRRKSETFAIYETLESPVPALATNLQTLVINNYRHFEEGYVERELSILLVQIRSLQLLCVPVNFIDQMLELTKYYGQVYPHVKSLQVTETKNPSGHICRQYYESDSDVPLYSNFSDDGGF
ncbi:hypothetical protein BX661DRAFT_96773 [Kickxella alabastrina]|uniref:uncharacterized protein n=1 Tax=Kickxella alabastrina TaxID=61397 RepID=UPI00221F1CD0|nr:uncharacterized protein BX661DRAFT_96773 [Kickxella alabastrina]KAI7830059.1 hypothetical protein BX661DRAFT_96773 [Kickxella alabastrina]